jgi:hypothetical protein
MRISQPQNDASTHPREVDSQHRRGLPYFYYTREALPLATLETCLTLASSTLGPYGAFSSTIANAPGMSLLPQFPGFEYER